MHQWTSLHEMNFISFQWKSLHLSKLLFSVETNLCHIFSNTVCISYRFSIIHIPYTFSIDLFDYYNFIWLFYYILYKTYKQLTETMKFQML